MISPFSRVLILLLCTCIFFPAISAQRSDERAEHRTKESVELRKVTPDITIDPAHLPLGETLLYTIKWTAVPAGTGKIVTADKPLEIRGTPCVQVTTTAMSNDFVSMFYPVRDKVQTFIDRESFRSMRYVKNLREGKYKRDEKIDFNYKEKTAHYFKHVHGKKKVSKTVEIPDQIQDPLSALFFLRHIRLRTGTRFSLPVHTGGKNWTAHVLVLKEDIRRIRFHGHYRAQLIEIQGSFEGIFVHKDKSIKVWVDKKTRIPLSAHAELPFGSMNLQLTDFFNSNLRPVSVHKYGRNQRRKRQQGDSE